MQTQVAQFVTPVIDWLALLPIIIVIGGGVIGILAEALAPERRRRGWGISLGLLATMGAFLAVVYQWTNLPSRLEPMYEGEFTIDIFSVIAQGSLAIIGFMAVLLFADRTVIKDGSFAGQPSDRPGSHEEELTEEKGYQRTEIFPLMLLSLGGMMVFPVANSFVSLFVALEVMSLPLYILAATARNRRQLSHEAALKYFILGAFASGFFLMGAAFIYGALGTLNVSHGGQILAQVLNGGAPEFFSVSPDALVFMLQVGVFLLMVGLLFKVGAAPFHAWTPDVYTGAPTPVTGFMAAGVKVAAFLAMMRFLLLLGNIATAKLLPIYITVIVLTIAVGTFGGLLQTNIKRLLAYSSIAHAGYIMLGIVGLTQIYVVIGDSAARAALFANLPAHFDVPFYLLAYGLGTMGIFALVPLVRSVDKDGNVGAEVTDFTRWGGLGRKHPLFGAAVTVFMLSFAGIPLTSGFIGKFLLFKDAYYGGLGWLVVVALISSAITAFFYFRVVRVLFFEEMSEDVVLVEAEGYSTVVVTLAVVGTIILGIFPSIATAVVTALPA